MTLKKAQKAAVPEGKAASKKVFLQQGIGGRFFVDNIQLSCRKSEENVDVDDEDDELPQTGVPSYYGLGLLLLAGGALTILLCCRHL